MMADDLAPNSLAGRRAKTEAATRPQADTIILSCKLKSGLFESSIEVPLYSTQEEMNRFAMAWLGLMDAGIKIGQDREPHADEELTP